MYGRECGLAQAILEVECGGLDLVFLMETTQPEEYSQNRKGYNAIQAVAHPTRSGGAQGDVGWVLQESPRRWGSEYTRFHGPNMVI